MNFCGSSSGSVMRSSAKIVCDLELVDVSVLYKKVHIISQGQHFTPRDMAVIHGRIVLIQISRYKPSDQDLHCSLFGSLGYF
jgi:hypothetical protein